MSTVSGIKHVTVIGAGTMGAQIAMVSALAGYSSGLTDISAEQLQRAGQSLRSRMDSAVSKGRRTAEEVEAAWNLLELTTERDALVAGTDVVIEAAVEDLGVKRELFAELDRVAPSHAVLTTNSSNIVSSQIASATGRPAQVCNMHFFNPALLMECVELVPHEETSSKTMDLVEALARSFGKSPVRLRREVPGFVANRLLHAIRREALELHRGGVADFADIDTAARTALRHPMGPFELMDLVGIDVVHAIRHAEYEQTGDPESLPDPLITELYEAGHYGRKTGRGWYTYE